MIKLLSRAKNKKGFTLIELIVVLAILGVILAIAVPRYTGLQADAQAKADRATAALIINTARLAEVNEGQNPGTVTVADVSANGIKIGDLVYLEPVGKSQSNNSNFALTYNSTSGKYQVAYGSVTYIEGAAVNN